MFSFLTVSDPGSPSYQEVSRLNRHRRWDPRVLLCTNSNRMGAESLGTLLIDCIIYSNNITRILSVDNIPAMIQAILVLLLLECFLWYCTLIPYRIVLWKSYLIWGKEWMFVFGSSVVVLRLSSRPARHVKSTASNRVSTL
jgi:hypothetical protein